MLDLAAVYQRVIDDVISKIEPEFQTEGLDEAVLDELRTLWDRKLEESGALTNPEAVITTRGPTPTPRQAAAAAAAAARNGTETGRQTPPPEAPLMLAAPSQEAAAAAAAEAARASALKQEPLLGQAPQQLPDDKSGLSQLAMRTGNGLPSHLALQQLQMPPDVYARTYPAASYDMQQGGSAGGLMSYGFAAPQQPQAAAPSGQTYLAPNDLRRKRQRDDFDQGAQRAKWQHLQPNQHTMGFSQPQPQLQQHHIPQQDGANDEDDDQPAGKASDADGAEDGLGSGDDDDEDSEEEDPPNVMACQYEKVHRVKNRWTVNFVNGSMLLNGKELMFAKATGIMEF